VIAQRRQKHHHLQPPTTEHSLRTIITDLTIIQSLLPSIPPLSIAILTLFRVVVISYIPYLALSFFVSFRVLCAIIGTFILTWRAPWAVVLRVIIWRSAWFRWLGYKSWALISGDPLPPPTMSFQSSTHSSTPVQSLRFLFNVYENQRWWMGLDWTAALLPGERPSWCSASQQPLSPPNAFSLPENTTVYLSDEKRGRLKRTATWKWEEPEWRVLVHKEGGGLSRVEHPLPSAKDETLTSSRPLKAAGHTNNTTADTTKNTAATSETDHISEVSEDTAEELLTDVDGWVYGDNKWENQSHRGGLGKVILLRFQLPQALTTFSLRSIRDTEDGPVLPLFLRK
jgi:Integral peroxisomal membrane peroxin